MTKKKTNKSTVALIIFIKNPQLGKAKTRIAQSVGDQKALEIYLQLLEHTRQVADQLQLDRHLFYSDFIDRQDEWDNNNYTKHLQYQGDLGERMDKAFAQLLRDYSKVIIIGSDCYELRPYQIHQAISSLDNFDSVIGPVTDGGYYLLGMRKHYPFLFEGIEWSTESVTSQTIRQAISHSISIKSIDELRDVDYIEDWERYTE